MARTKYFGRVNNPIDSNTLWRLKDGTLQIITRHSDGWTDSICGEKDFEQSRENGRITYKQAKERRPDLFK